MKVILRGALLILLLILLTWSLIAFGSVQEVPSNSIRLQETTEFVTETDAYIGEKVVIDGTVTSTEPVTLRISGSGPNGMTVMGAETKQLYKGYQLYVFGTLVDSNTVRADRIVIVEPWEDLYTIIASFIGGLLLFARLARHWRFDIAEMSFYATSDETHTGSNHD